MIGSYTDFFTDSAATAYNLTRAINILGTRTLCQALAI
jgi:hypothetical protein